MFNKKKQSPDDLKKELQKAANELKKKNEELRGFLFRVRREMIKTDLEYAKYILQSKQSVLLRTQKRLESAGT